MTPNAKAHSTELSHVSISNAFAALSLAVIGLLTFSSQALASKQAVDFFGGQGALGGRFIEPDGVAVNYSGAGGVPSGTFYATDGGGGHLGEERGNRVERFQREDNGTPADTTDDTYQFVSAWGAGIKGSGSDYEICTVAAECAEAKGIGGNGTLAGNGALSKPSGIAVDQDTGEVYVADSGARQTPDDNFRINAYSAAGIFLRSFGWDVVESGPDDNGTGYEICKAGVDVCKAGLPGAGVGQLSSSVSDAAEGIAVSQPDGNPATGTVFLGDRFNQRVNTYNLDGSSPGSIGSSATFAESQPFSLAIDSRGILYASNSKGANEIERYDTQNANGGGVGFLAPIASPPLSPEATSGLAVDPDSDGIGPESDVLYALRGAAPGVIQQFGPLNSPGLTIPPGSVDETHGTAYPYPRSRGLAVEPTTGRLYVAVAAKVFGEPFGQGVFVLDNEGPPPTASLDSLSNITGTSVVAHATIDPNGPSNTIYHFEYSTDSTSWVSTPPVVLGHQEDPQAVEETIGSISPGLHPSTHYFVRLIAGRRFGTPIVTPALDFSTDPAPPSVETTGAPVRTTTTAQLNGRVNPRNSATTYHFEYGTQGPCDANPCESTAARAVGSADEIELVSQSIEGLEPNTTYHYRVVGESAAPGSPSLGTDMTVTTRASDAPLSHGRFPGPPDSDRAYEQVNLPDTGGNPVTGARAVSDNGNRAFYTVAGGTPISKTGTAFSQLFAERTETGPHLGSWHSEDIGPPRDQLVGNTWEGPVGRSRPLRPDLHHCQRG